MSEAARTARAAAESDYTTLRNLVAELAYANSNRVDLFDIASTGFYTGWLEYLPSSHGAIKRIAIAGIRPRDRLPGLLLRALDSFRNLKAKTGAARELEALLVRVASKETWRMEVFTLPEGGFRGIAEYMPKEGSVMVRITIQGIDERPRVEALLLAVLEDVVGRTPK